MMRVSIKLAGPLNRYYKTTRSAKMEEVEIPEGSTVGDLLAKYDVPSEAVTLVVVNRQKAVPSQRLKDDDLVWVIPLAAGG